MTHGFSLLLSGLSGLGLRPGQEHCVVFLGKLISLIVPVSTQLYTKMMGNGKLNARANPMVD